LVAAKQLVFGNKGKYKVNLAPYRTITPWWTADVWTNRDCVRLNDVLFTKFNFIPSRCFECWKTQIITNADPGKQTVKDLFVLRDVLQSTGFPCKCGVDLRWITPNRYSGFIYGDSLEQAKTYHKLIKKRLVTVLPKAHVTVKRGCTEFEDTYGDSSKWEEVAKGYAWDALEDYLDALIETHDVPSIMGIHRHKDAETFRMWIEYAHGIGDNSWKGALKSQGYKPPDTLFFKAKTYHKE
jgi:hypothetical protein